MRPSGKPARRDKAMQQPAQDDVPTGAHYDRWILLGILAIALAIRGLYLGEIAAKPEFISPGVDAGFHQYWADGLVTGNWAPPPGNADPHTQQVPFVRPPGYPYFLAAIYSITGINVVIPRVVQMLLGLVNCLLAYAIGRRWFGARIALLWSTGMATYWAFVYFEGELHATTLTTTVVLAAVYLLGRWRERTTMIRALGIGVLLGMAALLRPNMLPVVIVAGVWMWWVARRSPMPRRGWRCALVTAFAAAATIAPATIRNYRVSGEFVLISANAGVNLYIGNNPEAQGHAAGQVPGYGRFHTPYDYPAVVAAVEREAGRTLSYGEVSAHLAREALGFIRRQPVAWLRLMVKKTLMFWGPIEIPNNWEIHVEHDRSPLLSHLPGGFPSVLALAVVGLGCELRGQRRRPSAGATNGDRRALIVLVVAVVAVMFAAIVPFFVAGRYRVPLIPYLLLFAAIAVDGLVGALGARRWRAATLTVLVLAVVYVPCRLHLVGPAPNPGRWHLDRGLAYARLDKFEPALAHYAQALELTPQSPHLRLVTAHALRRTGRLDEATAQLERVFDYANPYRAEARIMLAQVRLKQGMVNEAIAEYRGALLEDPHSSVARRELAWLLNVLGRPAEALVELEALFADRPDDAELELFLGMTLQELGRMEAAQAHIEAALRKRPDLRTALEQGPAHAPSQDAQP